jgi:hypothetical protein
MNVVIYNTILYICCVLKHHLLSDILSHKN